MFSLTPIVYVGEEDKLAFSMNNDIIIIININNNFLSGTSIH